MLMSWALIAGESWGIYSRSDTSGMLNKDVAGHPEAIGHTSPFQTDSQSPLLYVCMSDCVVDDCFGIFEQCF